MKYVTKHTTVNYNSGNGNKRYIVIHYTGNYSDTAIANANYFYNVYRGASAHYFIDDDYCIEVVSPSDVAWSVGVNYGVNNLFGVCNNQNSINVEMCSQNGKITDKTIENTITLVNKLMRDYSIPLDRVVRHYDVWSKQCPGWLGWYGQNQSLWDDFKKQLSNSKNVVFKKNAGLYTKPYRDDFGKTSVKKIKVTKGDKAVFISDDGYGWSCVLYNGNKYYCVNSRISVSGVKLSLYQRITLKTNVSKPAIKKGTLVTLISVVETGKYKNYGLCSYNGQQFYIKL